MDGVAAERTLRFLVQIDAHLDDAERDLERLKRLIESLDNTVGTAKVLLEGVEKVFLQIESIRRELEMLSDEHLKVIIEFEYDKDKLLEGLTDLMSQADQTIILDVDVHEDAYEKLEDAFKDFQENANIFVHFDVSEDEIREFKSQIKDINDQIKIRLDMEVDHSGVEDLRRTLNDVSSMSASAMIGVFVSSLVDMEIENLERKLKAFADKVYNAKIGLDAEQLKRELERVENQLSGDSFKIMATIDVAILEALPKIREVKERLEEIERTWWATLDIDNKKGLDKIRYFLGRLNQVAQAQATATLDANGEPAAQTINKIYVQFKNYARQTPTAVLHLDAAKAKADLQGFEAILGRYNNRWGNQGGIRARITSDISQALANIRILNRMLDNVEDEERRILIEAQITKAMSELNTLREFADAVGAQDPTLSVTIKGTAIATAELLGLQALADKLDGTNINFKLDVDDRLSSAIPNILGAFEMQVKQLDSVMATIQAVSFPAMATFFASLPGLVSAAGGAVGSLATAMAPGLAGGIGLAAGAATVGMGAILTFGSAMRSTGIYAWNLSETMRDQAFMTAAAKDAVILAEAAMKNAVPGTQDYTNKTRALALAKQQLEIEEAKAAATMEAVTPRLIALNKLFGEFEVTMIHVRAAMADAAAPAVFAWLNMMNTQMPRIQPHLNEMIGAMAGVVAETIELNQQGTRLAQWQRILFGIKAGATAVFQIFAGGLGIVRAVLSTVVPASSVLLQNIADLVTKAEAWTQTAEGTRAIANAWNHMYSVAQQLWGIAVNLAKGIWGVVMALNASGTGQWLLAQIERGAAAFAHMMRETGSARSAITDFVNSTKPLLQAAGGFIAALVQGFFELANMASQADSQGQRWGTLIGVFEALEALVPHVVEFLRHEFERIGPLLPGLIENIGIWATTFAKATPEMLVFIDTLTKALEAFNSLPEPVRIAIARTIAWGAALNALGAGALLGVIGSVGGAIAQFLMYKNIMGALGGQSKSTGGILSKLRGVFDDIALRAMYAWDALKAGASKVGPAISRLAGWFSRTLGPAVTRIVGTLGRVLGPVFTKLGPIIGRVIPWIVRFIAAFGRFAIVRGIIMAAMAVFSTIVGIVGAPVIAVIAIIAGLVAVAYLVYRNWNKIGPLLGAAWDWIKNKAIMVWNGIKTFLGNVWNGIQAKWGGVWQAVGGFLGNLWQGIVSRAKAIWNGIKTFFSSLWNSIKNITATVWNAIKVVLITILGLIIMAVRPIWNGIKTIVSATWTFIKNRTTQVWNAIKNFLRGVWQGIKNTVGPVLSSIKGAIIAAWTVTKARTQQLWNAVKNFFVGLWNSLKQIVGGGSGRIKAVVLAAWAVTKARTQQVWNAIRNAFRAVWNAIKSTVGPPLNAIKNAVGNAWNWVKARTSQIWNGIKNFFKSVWNAIKSTVGPPLNAIKNAVSTAWNWVKARTSSVWNAIKNFFKAAWNAIKATVGPPLTAIKNAVSTAWNWIKARTSSVWNAIKNFIKTVWNGIKSTITAVVNAIKGFLSNAWNTIKATASNAWNAIKSAVVNAWNAIKSAISNGINATLATIRNWGTQLYNLGKAAITGLINGIKSMAAAVGTAIGNLLVQAYNEGKKAISSSSPSKLFETGLGVTIPQGIAAGIQRLAGEPINKMRSMMSGLYGEAGKHDPDKLMGKGAAGLRQQTAEMQKVMRMHRTLTASSRKMSAAMQSDAMRMVQAMKMVEMQLRRNAAVKADVAASQAARTRGGGGDGRGGMTTAEDGSRVPRSFYATPPRSGGGSGRMSKGTRDEHHVFVHTDGPGAQHIDDEALADKLSHRIQKRRRRG